MKAINLARFTKKTVKEVKSNDMRKQILSARDANSKEYTGLSRDLNQLSKNVETLQAEREIFENRLEKMK